MEKIITPRSESENNKRKRYKGEIKTVTPTTLEIVLIKYCFSEKLVNFDINLIPIKIEMKLANKKMIFMKYGSTPRVVNKRYDMSRDDRRIMLIVT